VAGLVESMTSKVTAQVVREAGHTSAETALDELMSRVAKRLESEP
jgi:hypothetical protein